jgi:hypothetical protein
MGTDVTRARGPRDRGAAGVGPCVHPLDVPAPEDEIAPGSWMEVVAQVLPPGHQAPPPFTLGEAVQELSTWTSSARTESWRKRDDSLRDDVLFLLTRTGPRVRARVEDLVTRATTRETPRAVVNDAARSFVDQWTEHDTVLSGFRDLCARAAQGNATTADLRPLAEIVASQQGARSRQSWNVLHEVAALLGPNDVGVGRRGFYPGGRELEDASPAIRLKAAEGRLTAESRKGHVVVWLLYERAVSPFRLVAGPITFLRADWTVPNASREDGKMFPERDELRALLKEAFWLQELNNELETTTKRHVLVRVDLGHRSTLGAQEEAERLVEAILAFGVIFGGVSWLAEGSGSVMLDGQPMGESRRAGRGDTSKDDSYGMGAMSEILEELAGNVADALAARGLTDELIEAAGALREASLTDHRDVIFHGERAVTPRIATALEDHALELVASAGGISSVTLSKGLRIIEAEYQFTQYLLALLMAPFDGRRARFGRSSEASELERSCTSYRNGVRVVSIEAVVEHAAAIDALQMSELARVDFRQGITLVTDASCEDEVRQRVDRETEVVWGRLRRIRNSVTHGNPLTPSALASIRPVSERTSREALQIALSAFARDELIASNIARIVKDREGDRQALQAGESYVSRYKLH